MLSSFALITHRYDHSAEAGPFTVHFWAPMSKWFISGASFMELHRPTDKISLPQYTALTLTGFFFSRYALLVQPINYTLCSVNIALFGSSAWHLGRKIKADFIDEKPESQGK
jgi:mitochondrial pyruvate carrier 2